VKIGIDLSNICVGGGVTHIIEILRELKPEAYGIEQVVAWAGKNMLELLPVRPWLKIIHEPMLDISLPARIYWQIVRLHQLAQESACDVLFLPGAGIGSRFKPYVTMSQNLLPFYPEERCRYGVSWMYIRLHLLKFSQARSFRMADGAIFLSEYARSMVVKKPNDLNGISAIIPHGVNKSFFQVPKIQKSKNDYSKSKPFCFLYISTVDVYKHQWKVAEAISMLRQEGYPVALDFVGPAYKQEFNRMKRTLDRIDPAENFINYHGAATYEKIVNYYHQADAFVFASSCETFGQILLEAMASGLPIACSNRKPMTELLLNAGVYFDPEKPHEIANALKRLLDDVSLRDSLAHKAYDLAKKYSWKQCAHETFSFITGITRRYRP
jgi:glycosyltransferase involved in cell wall biosynthesis